MLKSSIKLTGKVNIKKYENGELIDNINIDNIIVTTGQNYIAQRILNNSTTAMSHMAIGSSQVPQTINDTALFQEITRNTFISGTVTNSEVEYVAAFTPPASVPRSITEAAILNASSAGTMLCRTTFPPVTQSISQTIAITWIISVG
jgi:hypothetical protein